MSRLRPVHDVNPPTGISRLRRSPMQPVDVAADPAEDNPYRELDLSVLCDMFEIYEEDF